MAALEGVHRSVCLAASASWGSPKNISGVGPEMVVLWLNLGDKADVCFSGLLFKFTQLHQASRTKHGIQTTSFHIVLPSSQAILLWFHVARWPTNRSALITRRGRGHHRVTLQAECMAPNRTSRRQGPSWGAPAVAYDCLLRITKNSARSYSW